jgi:hypothetical protein
MDGDNIDVCICLFYGGEWEFEGVMDDFNRGCMCGSSSTYDNGY